MSHPSNPSRGDLSTSVPGDVESATQGIYRGHMQSAGTGGQANLQFSSYSPSFGSAAVGRPVIEPFAPSHEGFNPSAPPPLTCSPVFGSGLTPPSVPCGSDAPRLHGLGSASTSHPVTAPSSATAPQCGLPVIGSACSRLSPSGADPFARCLSVPPPPPPISGGPRPRPLYEEEWVHGLCEWHQTTRLCCVSFCCWPCAVGQIETMMKKDGGRTADCGCADCFVPLLCALWPLWLGLCVWVPGANTVGFGIQGHLTTSRIKQRTNVRHDRTLEFVKWWCCPSCAAVQARRRLDDFRLPEPGCRCGV
eukprot:TRINITY_DN48483_c0_g1_i1.p1 TRINITY_DN48483_c0_g1~~TRINITY_DN48483_c0_g1_i1.p1  ORF type:complete len:306 (+),score=22.76 TRINITY_DN48483_c0_g1_i1:133-1050(+)